jgi:hypothetical protein
MAPTSAMNELSAESLHDTIDLPSGFQNERFQFFCKPIGMDHADRVYTKDGWFTRWLRTNMLLSKTLPTPREFLVKRLNVMFLHAGKPLRIYDTNLYGRTSIDFQINQKRYWQSPAWKCANPLAVFGTEKEISEFAERWLGATFNGATFNREVLWNGKIKIDGLFLSWQEHFCVEADICADIPADTQLVVDLDGVGSRAIL